MAHLEFGRDRRVSCRSGISPEDLNISIERLAKVRLTISPLWGPMTEPGCCCSRTIQRCLTIGLPMKKRTKCTSAQRATKYPKRIAVLTGATLPKTRGV